MYRMAALYVVERLKPQLFSFLTAVLTALNPTPARCPSIPLSTFCPCARRDMMHSEIL